MSLRSIAALLRVDARGPPTKSRTSPRLVSQVAEHHVDRVARQVGSAARALGAPRVE
ncbi:MAG: hypothetical protein ACQSGP_24245 [Frankia sp.]